MFKPTAKFKKILRTANCAWVYQDGIVIQQIKTTKSRRARIPTSVYHVIPCEIKVNLSYHYNDEMKTDIPVASFKRIVFHNTSLLIDGIVRINIHYNNISETMKKRGIHATTLEIHTISGMEIHINQFNFLSGDITIQPNIEEVDPYSVNIDVPDSIKDYKTTYDKHKIVHVYDRIKEKK